ncbi:MAG: AAA domain-containing protein [Terrimicrobiaceae bacterium]|nr:AAA domain-containing protein [Terrimicrobiaceae bacterium]
MPLSTEQQRLIAMLDYLEQWDKLNRAATFDVAAHQGGLLAWQADVEALPGVHLDVADVSGENWLEIERLRPKKPPTPPVALIPWLIVRDDPSAEPSHRETLPNPETPEQPLVFDEDLSLVSALESYRTESWREWSESEKPRRKSIATYDKLFNLLQTIETEGAETALELVWGIGVAVWDKEGKRIRYPLVSRLVEIDPITTDMAIRIRPREVPPILETDIYVALENPGLPAFEKAARAILDHPDCDVRPFDEASYEQLLAGAAGTLDRQARYWPREADFEPGKLPSPTEMLTITNSWVLFARRKGTNFLIEDIRRLREAVESEPVPDGAPRVLVETPEGAVPEREARIWRGLSSTGFSAENLHGNDATSTSAAAPGELYFPKPFNAEQVQIIDRLEHASGVVVQGPPGTGKTHTIANVICHYLAEGKRVLVTSKGESALAVLRQQLPAPVQSLTVSLLTSEREGLKQLEQSVSKITTEITNLNKADMRREIERCRKTIDQLHERIGTIDRELADWARRNIDPVPPALDGLQPAALAQHVVEGENMHAWFLDRLDGRPEHEATFAADNVARLRAARELAGRDLIYLNSAFPSTDVLPSLPQVGDLHRALLDLDAVSGTIDEQKVPRFRSISAAHLADAARVRDLLREAAGIRRTLSVPWLDWLRQQHEAGAASQPVFSTVVQIAEELSVLVESRRQFLGVAIEWEEEWDADDDLFTAIRNSATGKSAFGLIPFGKKEARVRFQRVRLNGQQPQKAEDWQWIESHLVLRRQTRTVVCRWNSLATECPAPQLPAAPVQALRSSEELLVQMREAHRWVNELAPSLGSEVDAVFADLNADGIPDDPARMEALADAIEIRLKRHRLESARAEQKRLRELFKTSSLPLFKHASAFVEETLGNRHEESLSVEKAWHSVLNEIERLCALTPAFATIREVCAEIESAGAPLWAARLRSEPHIDGATDWTPPNWASAWKWSRQFGYLLGIDGRDRLQLLAKQRLDLQNDLSSAYARLVEQLTWLKLRETLEKDAGLMAALQQYMAAIAHIGAGTGPLAHFWRRRAREAMRKGYEAVRCWIMPHWRVSESLPPDLAIFDLVIIDEASQSDLWALPALLRAKKLLVVGDHKQVSPAAIGMAATQMMQLYAQYLRDLPFGSVLTPRDSIYGFACVVFSSDIVRLREHFRCVEPIIEFSNHLCYNGEIRCLRVATATERITPPLVDVFVRDGARDARTVKINRAEARAIVDEIKVLTANPAFVKRTIGVVSLLGNDQPRFIFELLVAEIGEEKIVRHQIRCGDAMTFQGREADIVFISMVSDTETVRALSGEMYEQRFNVAVSRAKDRLYLYRSFRREDLRVNDLRARLLEHFAAPLHRDPEKKGRERCESDFERAVFDRLHTAGYRVTPQVSAGGYRIDLVVEGRSGRRLAIECDGDQYHTPDVWLEDLHRQRTLERAGWTFWRCWGSSFIRDPDECIADLLRTLERLGVEPVGAADVDFSEIVEYREVGAIAADAESPVPADKTAAEAAREQVPEPRQTAPDTWSAPGPMSQQRAVQSELLPPDGALPLRNNDESVPRAQVGDFVRYCFTDSPDDQAFVTIVETESKPHLNLINCETPIAKALLGMTPGQERVTALPGGRRTLRVLEIFKPIRR